MGPDDRRPGRRGVTILTATAASTSRVTVGTFVVNVMNRHRRSLARMASTLQIVSGGGSSASGSAAIPPSTPRSASTFRRGRTGGPPRGRVAVLRALWGGGRSRGRRRSIRSTTPTPARSPTAAAHPDRRRDAGRSAPRRAPRRRLVDVRRQLRGEPARLPRGPRGERPPAGGPARARRRPGRLARRRSDRRLAVGRRPASDVGAVAGRGCRRCGPNGEVDRGRRRARRGGRALVGAPGGRDRPSVAPSAVPMRERERR